MIDQLSIFAGPTLNLLVSNVREEAELIPALYHYTTPEDVNIRLSIGLMAGLQYEPQWGDHNSR